MSLVLLFLVLVLVVVVFAYYNWNRYPKGFPPHPTISIPIMGDLLSLGDQLKAGFKEMRTKYGDVFGLILGKQRLVVLCTYDLIQEASTREELCGRNVVQYIAKERGSLDPADHDRHPGVTLGSGKRWQELRRFSLETLGELMYGKQGAQTETLIIDEVDELCSFLESTKGRPVNARNKFNTMIVNALWSVTTSEQLKHEDPKLEELNLMLDNFIQEMGNPALLMLDRNPLLIKLASKFGIFSFGRVFGRLVSLMEKTIEPLEASYENGSRRNFVDCFLDMVEEQEKTKEHNAFLGKEGRMNLVNLLIDFFIAGSVPTSQTLLWSMLFMILNPDVQDRVQKELDEVVGKGNQATIKDRDRTPYIKAVIHEVQRCNNLFAIGGIPHRATKDCYLSTGHFIPRDTTLFLLTGALMSDRKEFPEPSKFDPTRHLNPDGSFKQHQWIIPFGLGKRRCAGEGLAKTKLYLFFTGIMSRFRVEKGHPHDHLTIVPIKGFSPTPHPFKIRFIPRF